MNKVFGKISDFAPIKEDSSRIVISYGREQADEEHATWREIYLYKKQLSQVTLADVKKAVIDDINARVKNAIISGFVFNEKPVWLSEENQLNFAQAVAPVAMKVGEEENGTPVYISFETQADVTEFVNACIAWKMNCLSAGWAEKDAIDWAPYEEQFAAAE